MAGFIAHIEAYKKNASWDDYSYLLLRMLLAPEKPAAKSSAIIIKTLKEHLSPAPLTIAERFRLYAATQEGVAEFEA
ncbi:hypothetical protein Z043_126058, partial [Scleropages formosus]